MGDSFWKQKLYVTNRSKNKFVLSKLYI